MSTEEGELHLRLKRARKCLKVTQAQLAETADVALNTLKQYESGRIRPGTEALTGYAKAGVNLRYLLLGEGEPLESAKAYDSSSSPLVLRIGDGETSWTGEMRVSRMVELMLAIAAEIERAETIVGVRLTEAKRHTVTQNLFEECVELDTMPRATTVLRFVQAAG